MQFFLKKRQKMHVVFLKNACFFLKKKWKNAFINDSSVAGTNCIKDKGKDVWNALKKDQKF